MTSRLKERHTTLMRKIAGPRTHQLLQGRRRAVPAALRHPPQAGGSRTRARSSRCPAGLLRLHTAATIQATMVARKRSHHICLTLHFGAHPKSACLSRIRDLPIRWHAKGWAAHTGEFKSSRGAHLQGGRLGDWGGPGRRSGTQGVGRGWAHGRPAAQC